MASYKLYLDTRKPGKDGTYPLKPAVHHKGKFMINLKIYLAEKQFDISKKNPVIGHPKKDAYNTTVKTKLNKAEDIILNTKGLKLLSNEELRNLIIEANDQEQEKNEKEEYKLIDYFIIDLFPVRLID